MFQRFQLLPTGEGVFQCGLCRIQCIQFGLGLLCWQREETGVVNLGLQGISSISNCSSRAGRLSSSSCNL